MSENNTGNNNSSPWTISSGQAEVLLNKGIELFQRGELQKAETIFRNIALSNSDISNAWNLLGAVSLASNNPENARDQFKQAISIDSTIADYHFNLALAYIKTFNAGEAIEALEAALAIRPDYIEALNTLASVFMSLKLWDQALGMLEQATSLDQNYIEAWINSCGVLQEMGKFDKAVEAGMRSIKIAPDNLQAVYNLARAYGRQENWDKAIKLYDRCIELGPDFINGYINKGWNHIKNHQYAEAESILLKALEIDPGNSEVFDNLALTLASQGRYDTAIDYHNKSIALNPDNPEAHTNLGFALLINEDFRAGWGKYEYGLKTSVRGPVKPSPITLWTGQSLENRLIYVAGEQGIGEQIMFSTMLPDLVSQKASVIYECDDRLIPLFNRAMPEIMTTPRSAPKTISEIINSDKQADFRIAVGSLGQFLRPTTADFKIQTNTLEPDPDLSRLYRQKYQNLGAGPVIGISWQSRNPGFHVEKSTDLEFWQPILSQSEFTFVSLQYGDVDADIAWAKDKIGAAIYVDPEVNALDSLEQSAAQISAVDLVISISNATVHIAGACGVKTWVILGEVSLWHWFRNHNYSLWYDSLELFRQSSEMNQQQLMNKIADKLSSEF